MIGILSSGLGGITVAKAIEQLLPQSPFTFLADLARSPYGTKSSPTICKYSIENAKMLQNEGARLIIIACNTISSVAAEELRRHLQLPVIDMISPTVEQALLWSRTGRIGIIGSPTTINSGEYTKKMMEKQPDHKIFAKACPLLAALAEQGWIDKRETKMILRRYLHPFKDQQIDTLILGSTHYPLLQHLIQARIGKKVKLVDSSMATALYLQQHLGNHLAITADHNHCPLKNRYLVTDLNESARLLAAKIAHRPIDLQPLH